VHGAAEHEDSAVELSSEESSDESCTPPPTTSSNQTSQDDEGTSPPTFKIVGDNIDKKRMVGQEPTLPGMRRSSLSLQTSLAHLME